jgi:endonuclease III
MRTVTSRRLAVTLTKPKPIDRIFSLLKDFVRQWDIPSVHYFKGNPFLVLVSCVLSQRTLEEVTLATSRRLFTQANTPAKIRVMAVDKIRDLIQPVQYAATKAEWIRLIALALEKEDDHVPESLEALMGLPGVGRPDNPIIHPWRHPPRSSAGDPSR